MAATMLEIICCLLTCQFVLIFSAAIVWPEILSLLLLLSILIVAGAALGLLASFAASELSFLLGKRNRVLLSSENKRLCVIVTGCDSGFGLLLAKRLAVKCGVMVIAGVLDEASPGAAELQDLSLVRTVKLDVTKAGDVERCFQFVKTILVKEQNYCLWGLVNNAGVVQLQMLAFHDIAGVKRIYEVNTIGMLRMCQTFWPLLQGHGRIVNVTSMASRMVGLFAGAYCMSKFASDALSKSLQNELKPLNISVCTVRPFLYKTGIITTVENRFGQAEKDYFGEKALTRFDRYLDAVLHKADPNVGQVVDTLEDAVLSRVPVDHYVPGLFYRFLTLLYRLYNDEGIFQTLKL